MAFFVLDSSAAHGLQRHAALVRSTKIDHETFCRSVRDAIAGKNAQTADKLSDHHSCRLGHWYDEVKEAAIRSSPHYAALRAPHARVHAAGKRALACHAGGDRAGTDAALIDMDKASAAVVNGLERLAADIQQNAKPATGARR